MPKIMMPLVDVRDVAYAHLQAIKVEEAKNKRFILSKESLWFKEFAEVLKQRYPNQKIKSAELGYCPVKVVSWFDKSVKLILPMWNRVLRMDNSQSQEVLGVKYISSADAIIAMAESLFDAGMIPRK